MLCKRLFAYWGAAETVLIESPAYHAYFPGFTPVSAAEVAIAYFRSISTPITGRILKLHKTTS